MHTSGKTICTQEEFYMLQPTNKSDRMCHPVAMTMHSCSFAIVVVTVMGFATLHKIILLHHLTASPYSIILLHHLTALSYCIIITVLYTTRRTCYAHARKTEECFVTLTWLHLLLSNCVCMPAGHTYKPWSGQLGPVRRNVKQRWPAGWTLLCSRWLCGALQLRPLPSCRPAISRGLPRPPTRHRRCYT